MVIVRDYRPEDDPSLVDIERESAQGQSVRLAYERQLFAARAKLYERHRILVGEENGRLVSVCAGALKRVVLGGAKTDVLYLFDGRTRAEARGRRLVSHVAEILMREAPEAQVAYGYVLTDNKAVRRAAEWSGTRVVARYDLMAIPVFRPKRERAPVAALSADQARERAARDRGQLPFAPDLGAIYSAPGFMAAYACGGTSLALWDPERFFATRIIAVPRVLRLAGTLFRGLSRWLRLPHIPTPGCLLRTRILFDPVPGTSLAELDAVLARCLNCALDQGVDFLIVPMARGNPLYRYFARRSLSRARCAIVAKPLVAASSQVREALEHLGDENFYLDVRDL